MAKVLNYVTKKIDKVTAKSVIESMHYRKTLGVFWEAFGLFENDKLMGVVCYGQPSAPIQKHAFKDRDFRLYELTRLVIDGNNKNCASMLIAESLKMLNEQPSAVISYADSALGHVGIVYQASNWIYTGATTSHDKLYMVDGKSLHPMTLRDKFGVTNPSVWAKENGVQTINPSPKHRYFYFNGNKYQRKNMISKLSYPLVSQYPKAPKTYYTVIGDCNDAIANIAPVVINKSQMSLALEEING
jgi:hypothetical protein